MKIADVGYGCVMPSTLMEDNYTFIIYGIAFHIHGKALQKSCQRMRFFAFLGHFRLWMDMILVARWNGLEILVPKHMWKRKIRLPEQK